MTTPARRTHYPVIHEISATLGPNSPASGILGTLPAGAVVSIAHYLVTQGFNSTTNTLSLGVTPGAGDFVFNFNIAAPTRSDNAPSALICGPFPTATSLYYTLGSTGAAPTQGSVTLWVDYIGQVG